MPDKSETRKIWALRMVLLLVIVCLAFVLFQNDDSHLETSPIVPQIMLEPFDGPRNPQRGSNASSPFSGQNSNISKFLKDNPNSAAAHLAVAYCLTDLSMLHRWKEQFKDDPVFALHYLSAFPDCADSEHWLDTMRTHDPNNSFGVYLEIGTQLAEGEDSSDAAWATFATTSKLSGFDNYSITIEAKAREFFTQYLGWSLVDATIYARTKVHFTPSPWTIAKIAITVTRSSTELSAEMAAAAFNLGTNLSATGEPGHIAIGAGLEGTFLDYLLTKGVDFGVNATDVRNQLDEDLGTARQMLALEATLLQSLNESNVQDYIHLLSNEGRIAAFKYLESIAPASSSLY